MRILAILLAVSSTMLGGQTPAPAPVTPPETTAAISGIVVDGASGDPVENANVTLDGANVKGLAQVRQITDAKGRFVFVNLPPGSDYALNASMSGYFGAGLTRGTGILDTRQLVTVKVGEWVRDLQIKMWKPGAISGRVVDEAGEPVVGVFVRALKRAPVAGREQLVNMATAVTDDRGIYRVTGLDAGRYAIEVPSVQGATPMAAGPSMPADFLGIPASYPGAAARGRDNRARVYPITFSPAARTAAEASVIDVRLGEERQGVDVGLTPASVFTVKGRLIGHSDALTLRLMPAGLEALGNGSEAAQSQIGADGAFSFENVPAGNYLLVAGRRVSELQSILSRAPRTLPSPAGTRGWSSSTMALTAAPLGLMLSQTQYGNNPTVQGQPFGAAFVRMPITVENDITGLAVTLRDGAVMDVTVQFDPAPGSTTVKPPQNQLGFSLDAANGDPDLGIVSPKQEPTVRFDGIGAGEFWLRVRATNWVVKQITWGGQDYTTRPFDAAATSAFPGVTVVMTDRVAAISGTVKEKDAAVVMFPVDQAQWTNIGFNPTLIKSTLADETGKFTFTPLPAGEYFVLAVPRAERYDWIEPGYFTRAFAQATRVSLDWSDRKTLTLSVTRVPR